MNVDYQYTDITFETCSNQSSAYGRKCHHCGYRFTGRDNWAYATVSFCTFEPHGVTICQTCAKALQEARPGG